MSILYVPIWPKLIIHLWDYTWHNILCGFKKMSNATHLRSSVTSLWKFLCLNYSTFFISNLKATELFSLPIVLLSKESWSWKLYGMYLPFQIVLPCKNVYWNLPIYFPGSITLLVLTLDIKSFCEHSITYISFTHSGTFLFLSWLHNYQGS